MPKTTTGVVEPIHQTGAEKCTGAAEKPSKRRLAVMFDIMSPRMRMKTRMR